MKLVLAIALLAAPAWAADSSRPFIVDRGSGEVLFAEGGWRSGLSTQENNPGFSVLGGGGEVLLSLDPKPGFGIVADGRVIAGPRLNGVYIEGLGGVALQLRVSDWVRVRVGAAAGQARLDRHDLATDTAILVGGWAAVSVDLFRLFHERAATIIALRLDADGHVDPGTTFSKESIALSLAVGVRF